VAPAESAPGGPLRAALTRWAVTALVVLAPSGLIPGAGCSQRADDAAPRAAARDGEAAARDAAQEPKPAQAADRGPEGNRRRRAGERESRDEPTTDDAEGYRAAMIEGDAALESGLFEEARQDYFRAMEARSKAMAPALGAIKALRIRGHAEERAGVVRTVERRIAELRQTPATQGAADLLSARLAIALDKPGEAMDRARLAVTHMPELGVAWRVLGEAAMAAEEWGQAVEALQRAAALGLAAKAGTWERIADALDELGDEDGATRAAEKAVALTGSDPHARRRRLNLLGVVRKHGGDLDGAAAALDEARLLGPDDPAVLHNLATLAEARGRTEEAVRLYTHALAIGPVPMTSWRLGKALLAMDRPNEALTAFTAAAAHLDRWTWPRSTRWWPAYDLGKLYVRAGQVEEALGWFSDAARETVTPRASREVWSWIAYARTLAPSHAEDSPTP